MEDVGNAGTPTRDTPREVAAQWVARLASGEATPGDKRNLEDWLAADERHRRAFDALQTIWGGLAPLEVPARRLLRRRAHVLAAAFVGAIAACLAAVALAPRLFPRDYVSPAGTVREAMLADGSRIWLDTDAAVDFRVEPSGRTLDVVRGRIHVSVAHDERTPFTVLAKGARIRDIGTSFTVDVERDALQVAVVEGAVEVDFGGTRTNLMARDAAGFVEGQAPKLERGAAAVECGWCSGRIVLDQTSLSETLRQVDRYRRGKIILADSSLAERTVSGGISIAHLEEGLDALADTEGLRLIRLPGLLIVTSSTPER